MSKQALLIRLQYPYGKKQIYFPTDLLLVASRLKQAGIEARLHDLNLRDIQEKDLEQYDFFGIGVIGAPYIPAAKSLAAKLSSKTNRPVAVGGQIIENLSPEHFEKIFGSKATQIKNDLDLTQLLEISSTSLPSPYKISIAPTVSTLPQEDFKKYLSREFGFFISQGCKFRCDFCGAKKQQKEIYRDIEVIRTDLETLTKKAKDFGIKKMKMYLSALDLFQTPEKLAEVFKVYANLKKEHDMDYELRGLARIDSFVQALEKVPQLESLANRAGLKYIGFGIDGTTEKIWKSQHKGRKNLSEIDLSLDKCQEIGIIPELLMVMGFPEDTIGSLLKNYVYTIVKAFTHNAISRPYLAKPFVPGNAGWTNGKYNQAINHLIENPKMFVNLDLAALGSKLTHSNRIKRFLSNFSYLTTIATLEPFGRNATYPLLPKSAGNLFSAIQNTAAHYINRFIPFDK